MRRLVLLEKYAPTRGCSGVSSCATPSLLLPFCFAQYGFTGGYGPGFGAGYGAYGMPFLGGPFPFMGSQMYGYGLNPMIGGGMGGVYGAGGVGGCLDLHPQCSVWASTGQCATNAIMMRQSCALSCGTCATGLSSSTLYNPLGAGGVGGLGILPTGGGLDWTQFIGRSIYETGILRQPTPHVASPKDNGILSKAKSARSPSWR